jgi:ABC-type glycerol-3-phosphate transport system substrate-binding protein
MKTILCTIGLVGAALALSACGGGGGGGGSPAASTPPPSASTPPPSASQPPPSSSQPEAVDFTAWMLDHASPSPSDTAPTKINKVKFKNMNDSDPNAYSKVFTTG